MDDNIKSKEQKKRLDKLAIHMKMSLVDLAELVGLNKNTLYHVGTGVKGEMSTRTASRLCYHLEKKKGVIVNREWLLDGVGEMIDEKMSLPYNQAEAKGMQVATAPSEPIGEPDYKAKYLDLMERYIVLQQEYMELIKRSR